MLQGQDWSTLGKKTLKQAPNNLCLTATDIFTTMLQRALPACTGRTGIPLTICCSMGKDPVHNVFVLILYFQHLITVDSKRINYSKWQRPQSESYINI